MERRPGIDGVGYQENGLEVYVLPYIMSGAPSERLFHSSSPVIGEVVASLQHKMCPPVGSQSFRYTCRKTRIEQDEQDMKSMVHRVKVDDLAADSRFTRIVASQRTRVLQHTFRSSRYNFECFGHNNPFHSFDTY